MGAGGHSHISVSTHPCRGPFSLAIREWPTKSLIARCCNVPARGPKPYPRCVRDRTQSLLFGTLNVLRPARSSHSDHGSGSHSLCLALGTETHPQHNARDRTLIPTTRHLTTTEDRTLILTTRRNDDDIHYNIQHSSVFLTSSLCRIHQCDTAWVGQRLQSSGFPSWRRGGPERESGDEPVCSASRSDVQPSRSAIVIIVSLCLRLRSTSYAADMSAGAVIVG